MMLKRQLKLIITIPVTTLIILNNLLITTIMVSQITIIPIIKTTLVRILTRVTKAKIIPIKELLATTLLVREIITRVLVLTNPLL
ncbi:hypothetical protein LrDSM24759_08120 [Lactobacillus rodentium]|uniref:Uncharacterized protein n=1 Tax=Lactobacillus rodentium TaxID=947835 RepID=A0A2Z6T8W0_9LACO|nr:hypothetical protein LrDSM24759_08120 [Lactobacillus rodentium]